MMFRKNLINTSFQTFFVSKEKCSCPLAFEVIKISEKIKKLGLLKNATVVVSLSYGKRMIVQRVGSIFSELDLDDFVEVVDYDPLKNIMLVIGKSEPCIEASVHWMIHHARGDINAILQINEERDIERFSKKFPMTEKVFPLGSIELVKEVLKTLNNSTNIIIKDTGVMFTGANLKELEDTVLENIGGVS
jgi:hypothetical protein